jgi:hypothetical protein
MWARAIVAAVAALSIIGLGATPALASTELVGNGGFEITAAGWSNEGLTSETLTRTTADSHSGSASALLAFTSTNSGSLIMTDAPDWLKGPSTYTSATVSVWVNVPSGHELKFRLREYCDYREPFCQAVSGLYFNSVTATSTGSWQQLTATVTLHPGDGDWDDFDTEFEAKTLGNTDVAYIDDWSIVAS